MHSTSSFQGNGARVMRFKHITMNTTLNQSNTALAGIPLKGILAAFVAAALPLYAQVVIEGGPGTVQVSDRDGQSEAVDSAPEISPPITKTVPTTGAATAGIDGNKRRTVEANALEGTTVNVPVMK